CSFGIDPPTFPDLPGPVKQIPARPGVAKPALTLSNCPATIGGRTRRYAMLYESAHVTLAADYRVATLTLTGGSADRPLLCRAALDDLDAALRAAARNP